MLLVIQFRPLVMEVCYDLTLNTDIRGHSNQLNIDQKQYVNWLEKFPCVYGSLIAIESIIQITFDRGVLRFPHFGGRSYGDDPTQFSLNVLYV